MRLKNPAAVLKPLPCLIGLCGLLLGFKGYSLVDQFTAVPVYAEGSPAAESGQASTEKKTTTADLEKEKIAKAVAEQIPDAEAAKDIIEFTPSEINLLQSLRERREQLAKREEALSEKERLLEGLKTQLDAKINEMNAIKEYIEKIRDDIEARSKKFKKSEDAEILNLVRIYEKMKPKEAARIFDNLDLTILVDVVKNIKDSKLAPIMAAMDPVKARQLTTELGKREDLPALPPQ